MKIGDLFLRVIADMKGFAGDVNFQAAKAGDKAGATLGKSLSASIKKGWTGENIGKGLVQGLGLAGALGAANALAGGLGAVRDGIEGAISDASDLAESTSKVGVVFGESSDSVLAFGKNAAHSMGLSNQAALEATGTLGNLLLSMGNTSEKAATMSTKMVQLAADLASFNNVDIQEVLMAMRSGLTGEIAPLRRFGVNLTDATLRAKAMQLGLSDGKSVLDASAKSAAAYALILEQTTTAQGDFARTSTGLANQQRILNAELENTSATLGQKLIPLAIGFQKAMIYALDRTSISLDELRQAAARGSTGAAAQLHQLENVAQQMGISVEDAWNKVNEAGTFSIEVLQGNAKKAKTANESFTSSSRDMARGMLGVGRSAAVAEAQWSHSLTNMVAGYEKAAAAMTGAAAGLADALFDPIIEKANLAELDRTAAELRAERNAADAHSRERDDAQAKLTEVEKSTIETLGKLAAAGDEDARIRLEAWAANVKATREMTSYQIAQLKLLEQELARARLRAAELANALSLGHNKGGQGDRGRASGGYYPPGWSGTVGEEGPEGMISFTGGGGVVIPNPSSGAGSAAAATSGSGGPGSDAPAWPPITIHNPVPHAAEEDVARTLRRLGALGLGG